MALFVLINKTKMQARCAAYLRSQKIIATCMAGAAFAPC